MTNAQKWVVLFLAVFIVLFVVAKLTQSNDTDISTLDNYSATETGEPESQDGITMLQNVGCLGCHGTDLRGTKLAPALVAVSKNWDREGLINYLRNPSSYSGDERFEQYKKQFPNIVMPSYNNIDVKTLGKIADYLLQTAK